MRKSNNLSLFGILIVALMCACTSEPETKSSEEKASEMTRELIKEMESQTDTLVKKVESQPADSAETAK